MEIKVYQSEIDAGIGDLVAKGSFAFASSIQASEIKDDLKLPELVKALASANPNQIDLYYKHAVLASVGMNKNDDVFLREETWKARNTVVDKQLNLRHDETDIIGHMTNSYVVDQNGLLIPEETAEADLPNAFDIVNEFVIYKAWEGQERRKEIYDIIQEIENGEWYVSMECRFPAFDYAFVSEAGEQRIVKRDESTAFLTKHLRLFGGTGEYQGFKVGRVLRDFFFSGQGIVKVPANERSVIFDPKTIAMFQSQGSLTVEEERMAEETNKLVLELQEQLKTANAKIVELESASSKKILEQAQASLKTSEEGRAALETQLAKAKEEIAKKDEVIANLTTEVKTAQEAIAAAEKTAEEEKKNAKAKARKDKLTTAGVTAENVEAEATKWESLSDEQFDGIVELIKSKSASSTKAEEKVVEKTVETAKVEEAVVETNAALAQVQETEKAKAEAMKSVSDWVVSKLPFAAKAEQRINPKN